MYIYIRTDNYKLTYGFKKLTFPISMIINKLCIPIKKKKIIALILLKSNEN